MQTSKSALRKKLLLGAAAISFGLPATTARSQDASPTQTPTSGTTSGTGSSGFARATPAAAAGINNTSESITVRAQRRLLKEKDSPSAVTELGQAQIAQTGVQGSVATLLRAAPSVNVYQQGIGNNEPVLSIRGTRGLETAQTLDDVPMQDLLNGGTGAYLQNIIGGRFNLDQISGVSIYPGVAYPDKNTFGTIGGTIAYNTLRPSNDRYVDLTGSIGSFGTYNEGFELNSGRLNGFLGTGDDAPKFLLKYSNLQTNGFIDYTPARYNNVDFAFDKPYDGGLSKFQATVLYNTANGLVTPEPIPLPYLGQNGMFSNYSPDQEFSRDQNDYLTIILKDDTYINDYFNAGLSVFYLNSDSTTTNYGNPAIFSAPGIPGSVTVGGAAPFNQTPAGFGQQGDYGPGQTFYQPPFYTYNGTAAYPAGTGACPASVAAAWAKIGQTSPCGYNAYVNPVHNDSYGFQPRLTFTAPEVFGIGNTVKLGGLVAKETQANSPFFFGGTSTPPRTAANISANAGGDAVDGGVQRTIYLAFLQDKIDLLHNTLHLTPGVTLEGTASSYKGNNVFGGTPSAATLASAYCQNADNSCNFGNFKATKWDKEALPFFNVDYDLDRVLPAAKGVSLYASYGESALFAPTTDFTPNLLGTPPSAAIVHMYEAGVKYNISNLVLSADYYYQKVDRDFGFFTYQSGPLNGDSLYTNDGQREFKGIEAAATWQATRNWQLFGNVSHVLAKYLATSLGFATVQQDQFGIVTRGSPISGVPDWLSTFGVDYNRRNLGLRGDELNVRFEGQYTGKQYTTYDLTGLQNVGSVPGVTPFGSYQYYNVTSGATTTNPNSPLNPFVVFNLDMNYKLPVQNIGPLKTISFDLNVLNLFDNHYFQYYYNQITPQACPKFTSGPFKGQQISNYGCSAQFADGLPGEPFAITFTATARF